MLRTALPKQRYVWVAAFRRSQSTFTPPNVPKAPGPSEAPPPAHTAPPPLPPDPPASNASATQSSSSRSESNKSPPPPTPPPKPKRRFRRYFLYPTAFLGLAYAAGVYYALVSDNFHDFFTEYVPFGEDAVLFWEEREFKRRFPSPAPGSASSSKTYPQISGEDKVTVGRQSGVSAKTAGEQTKSKGDQSPPKRDAAVSTPPKKDKQKESKTTLTEKTDDKKGKQEPKSPAKIEQKPTSATSGPISQLDSLKIDNAADPVVQNITKILNDVIAVVNADNASGKYSATISKAKDDVQKLASDTATYRAQDAKAAADKIRQNEVDFDKGAQELIARIQREQNQQELAFREEYEAERERLAKTYEEKLRAELEAAQKVADQRKRNELIEQSIKLTDQFTNDVRERVEKERSSRLSRINQLAHDVADLEGLTKKYTSDLQSNLQTQHLITAVEAVRTALEDTDRPVPFIHELVALKEISKDDAIVSAAISSIDPIAYQRGVSTPAQLIDRFRRVADEVRKASLLPENAGAASHAASFMLSRFLFKKEGLTVGEDVESVLTRTETLLEEGNLDDATREMNGLTGWARVLSTDWLTECRRALEVRQALDVSICFYREIILQV